MTSVLQPYATYYQDHDVDDDDTLGDHDGEYQQPEPARPIYAESPRRQKVNRVNSIGRRTPKPKRTSSSDLRLLESPGRRNNNNSKARQSLSRPTTPRRPAPAIRRVNSDPCVLLLNDDSEEDAPKARSMRSTNSHGKSPKKRTSSRSSTKVKRRSSNPDILTDDSDSPGRTSTRANSKSTLRSPKRISRQSIMKRASSDPCLLDGSSDGGEKVRTPSSGRSRVSRTRSGGRKQRPDSTSLDLDSAHSASSARPRRMISSRKRPSSQPSLRKVSTTGTARRANSRSALQRTATAEDPQRRRKGTSRRGLEQPQRPRRANSDRSLLSADYDYEEQPRRQRGGGPGERLGRQRPQRSSSAGPLRKIKQMEAQKNNGIKRAVEQSRARMERAPKSNSKQRVKRVASAGCVTRTFSISELDDEDYEDPQHGHPEDFRAPEEKPKRRSNRRRNGSNRSSNGLTNDQLQELSAENDKRLEALANGIILPKEEEPVPEVKPKPKQRRSSGVRLLAMMGLGPGASEKRDTNNASNKRSPTDFEPLVVPDDLSEASELSDYGAYDAPPSLLG